MENFNVNVDGLHTFPISSESINQLDWLELGNQHYHVLSAGISYQVHIITADIQNQVYTIELNGKIYQAKIEDHYENLMTKLGLNTAKNTKINTIKAPMPGLVIDVMTAPGSQISKGDTLLILEAMKMENSIKATQDGIVKNVMVEKGTPVEKNQLLLELE
jgi:biotin carboxyl carrier protein